MNAYLKSVRWFLLFSAPVAIMFAWVVITETLEYHQSAREISQNAQQAATAYANSITAKLNHQFTELEFASSLLSPSGNPDDQSMLRFIALHPNLFALNILSADGTRILWSTYTQSTAPIVPLNQFTPLASRPNFLLGQNKFAPRYHSHILPMRYRVADHHGRPTYFIGTPYRLDRLLDYPPQSPWTFTIVDNRQDNVLGQWHQGGIDLKTQIVPPSELLTKVSGYPYTIHTSWPEYLVRDEYWGTAKQRWMMEIIMLILLSAISLTALNLLRARERSNRRLQRLSDFNRMFAEINQIIATSEQEDELLESICDFGIAYGKLDLIWIGQPNDSGGFSFLASAGHTRHLKNLQLSTRDAQPSGHGPSARAWREGRAVFFSPETQANFPDHTQKQAGQFGLQAIASLPIKRHGALWAILTVYHQNPDAFEELNSLLEELAEDISRGLDRLDLLQRDRHSSALNQAILDNATAGIMLIRDQVIYFVNQRLIEILNAPDPNAIIGHTMADFLANPADQESLHAEIKQAFEQGRQAKFDAQFQQIDGSLRWFSLTGKPFPEGGFDQTWIVTDVTEHLQALNQQLLLASALAAVQEGVTLTDAHQRIVYINAAFTTFTGFKLNDVQGQTLHGFLATAQSDMATQIRNSLTTGNAFHGQLPIRRKNGTEFWSMLTINPIHGESGTITHYVTVLRDISALRQLNEQLLHQSLHDELTQLPNRRALEQHLHQRIPQMKRTKHMLAVGMIDLDDFKPINDTWGHEAGDTLLRELARRLTNRLREQDMLARLGGDEFVIVIEQLDPTNPDEQLHHVLERLHQAIDIPFDVAPNQQAVVGMSLGIALFPSDGMDGDTLLRQADAALYQVKMHKHQRSQWWQIGVTGTKALTLPTQEENTSISSPLPHPELDLRGGVNQRAPHAETKRKDMNHGV